MNSVSSNPILDEMRTEIDNALHHSVDRLKTGQSGLWEMASYAMGWSGKGAGTDTTGKRIRPLLCLLVCGGCRSNWRLALPPACAVELVHSFSLIHDDIQDGDPTRRGRPTVWKRHGPAQAINVGDAVFTLAFSVLSDAPCSRSANWLQILSGTCLKLTYGQYLDLTYQDLQRITLNQYLEMIEGKTAALVEAACRLGAMSADAPSEQQESFAAFGRAIGLAFQIQDDYLGVWGDPSITGKPNIRDLLARKKSLPIVYGLEQSETFRTLLAEERTPAVLPSLLEELESCGAKEHTLELSREWVGRAFEALHAARPEGVFERELESLVHSLLDRRK
jgi:geranylgeranyl diphosphate synthase type I